MPALPRAGLGKPRPPVRPLPVITGPPYPLPPAIAGNPPRRRLRGPAAGRPPVIHAAAAGGKKGGLRIKGN